MNKISLQFTSSGNIKNNNVITNRNTKTVKYNIYDKNKNFYVCSYGGSGSTMLFEYLKNFGNVYHIHDRYPPDKLEYVGKDNTDNEVYSEWFNGVKIPDNEIHKYKVIFIYRHPIDVIYSRFIKPNGPNIPHLQHIMCDNNGNINIFDVLKTGKDLYKLEEFFDNYTINKKRNYDIYCIKYEMFWNNIQIFNKLMDIPDIKELYPIKKERAKKYQYITRLYMIYAQLIYKMNMKLFVEIVKPSLNETNVINQEDENQ